MIRAIRTIAAKDLRERLRDKSFFLLGILTPLALAFVLNLVFGGLNEGELEVRMGVVDNDTSEASRQFVTSLTELDGAGGTQIFILESGADVATAIDDNRLDAVAVVAPGFEQAVATGGAPQLELVENPDRPIQAGVAGSILDGFAAQLNRSRLLAVSGAQLGVVPPATPPAADVDVTRQRPGGDGLGPNTRLMAGMAIMFVFFTVSFGVTSLLNERKDGTLARLLAAPIPRSTILTAKALVSYLLGVLATVVLMVAAQFLMGAEWGPWPGVIALVLAAVLTAVAIMAVVAGVAKTAEGAGGAQSIIAVGLALIGGSWFEISGEGVMGMVTQLTPHYWFLEGLGDLIGATSWTVILPHMAALIAFALIAGVPATVLLRRKLAP